MKGRRSTNGSDTDPDPPILEAREDVVANDSSKPQHMIPKEEHEQNQIDQPYRKPPARGPHEGGV